MEDPDPPSLQTIAENRWARALHPFILFSLKEAGLPGHGTAYQVLASCSRRRGHGVRDPLLHLKHFCALRSARPALGPSWTSHPQKAAFCLLLLQLFGVRLGGAVEGEGVSPFNHALQFGWVGAWGLQGTSTASLPEHATFRTFSSHWLRGEGQQRSPSRDASGHFDLRAVNRWSSLPPFSTPGPNFCCCCYFHCLFCFGLFFILIF